MTTDSHDGRCRDPSASAASGITIRTVSHETRTRAGIGEGARVSGRRAVVGAYGVVAAAAGSDSDFDDSDFDSLLDEDDSPLLFAAPSVEAAVLALPSLDAVSDFDSVESVLFELVLFL
jgi:hypothetical protein